MANTLVAPEMSRDELEEAWSGATLAVRMEVKPASRIVEDRIKGSGKFS
jgi:hypothetical protein